jgi:hypothetical protein
VRLAAVVGWTVRHHAQRVLEESDMDALTEAGGRGLGLPPRSGEQLDQGERAVCGAWEILRRQTAPDSRAARTGTLPRDGRRGAWHGWDLAREGVEQA